MFKNFFSHLLTKCAIQYTSDRTIDNTLGGIKQKLQQFYDYKSKERSEQIVKNLDLSYGVHPYSYFVSIIIYAASRALFDNLALRLKNNNRPAFTPEFPPSVLDQQFVALDNSEAEFSKHLHAELERQIHLDNLSKRFKKDEGNLANYVSEKLSYANKTESIDSIESAKFYLEEHALIVKEVELTKASRVAQLQHILTELANEKYEFIGNLQGIRKQNKKKKHCFVLHAHFFFFFFFPPSCSASFGQVSSQFAALEGAIAKKNSVLLEELEKQKKINDDLNKEFAAAVKNFTDSLADKKAKVNDKNAELAALLSLVASLQSNTTEINGLVDAVKAADAKVQARLITVNPYTSTTANDVEAQQAQFVVLLGKKKELLESEIENQKRQGITEEQLAEINQSFIFFDKNKSGFIDRRELRSVLQSLGEDVTPVHVEGILKSFGQGPDGHLSKDNFTQVLFLIYILKFQ